MEAWVTLGRKCYARNQSCVLVRLMSFHYSTVPSMKLWNYLPLTKSRKRKALEQAHLKMLVFKWILQLNVIESWKNYTSVIFGCFQVLTSTIKTAHTVIQVALSLGFFLLWQKKHNSFAAIKPFIHLLNKGGGNKRICSSYIQTQSLANGGCGARQRTQPPRNHLI